MIKNFNVKFTEKEISSIYQKVRDYHWDSVKDLDGWEHGTNKKYLKELCSRNFAISWIFDEYWCCHKFYEKGLVI
tara:strand:+ start:480 stop:704 length:225 start_codon:yes stop_codon:yes gene_type:complete